MSVLMSSLAHFCQLKPGCVMIAEILSKSEIFSVNRLSSPLFIIAVRISAAIFSVARPKLWTAPDVVPGIDYNALTISINADETWRDAQAEKANYLQLFQRRSIDPNSWQYCVADSATIAKLTGISGFLFQRVGVEFAHTGALIIVSPKGKIVRYLYGTEHLKFDFKMALNEALAERPGATITKVLEYCFSYDPAGRTYVFNFTRVAGTIVLILLFLFVLVFLVRRRRNPQSQMQR
jgi:protein SCO1/2